MIYTLAVSTMTIGNLFAMRQQNIKRFLAFSSIAQVGFILLGISSNSNQGLSSVVYFVLIYIFSNLAALGVAGIISNAGGKEDIKDYRNESLKRYEKGEMFSKDSISFPDSLMMKTLVTKRKVYAGGGIMPDIFIPMDTSMYYRYFVTYFCDAPDRGPSLQIQNYGEAAVCKINSVLRGSIRTRFCFVKTEFYFGRA